MTLPSTWHCKFYRTPHEGFLIRNVFFSDPGVSLLAAENRRWNRVQKITYFGLEQAGKGFYKAFSVSREFLGIPFLPKRIFICSAEDSLHPNFKTQSNNFQRFERNCSICLKLMPWVLKFVCLIFFFLPLKIRSIVQLKQVLSDCS